MSWTAEQTNQLVRTQIGVETTLGTEVNATIALGSVNVTPTPNRSVKPFTPRGVLAPTVAPLVSKFTTFSFEGTPTFEEVGYFIKDLVTDAASTPTMYTVEIAEAVASPAGIVTYTGCVVDSWNIECVSGQSGGLSMSGSMIGRYGTVKQGTASLSVPALTPILAEHFYPVTTTTKGVVLHGGDASPINTLKWFRWSLSASNIWQPVFMKGNPDMETIVQGQVETRFKILVEADAAALALLSTEAVLDGSYVKTGTVETSHSFNAVFDCRLDNVGAFQDEQGIYAYELDFLIMNKATTAIDFTIA